jgi:hypothetical protein
MLAFLLYLEMGMLKLDLSPQHFHYGLEFSYLVLRLKFATTEFKLLILKWSRVVKTE